MSRETITRGSSKRIRVQFLDQDGDPIAMDTAGYLGTGQFRWDGGTSTTVIPTSGSNFTWTDQPNGIGYFHWTDAETTADFTAGQEGFLECFVWYSTTENYPCGRVAVGVRNPKTVTLAAQS